MEKQKDKSKKNKAIKGVATLAVLSSLVAGMLFNSATEITPEMTQTSINQPPVVLDLDEFANATVDDDDDATEEKKNNGGIVTRIKQALASLPYAVRLLILTPLWAIGTVLLTVLGALWNVLIASPIGALLISVVVAFAIILGVYVATAKTLFPDVPLRKILSKEAFIGIGIAALAISGIDALMPLFWAKYPFYSGLVKLGLGAVVITALTLKVKKYSNNLLGELRLN